MSGSDDIRDAGGDANDHHDWSEGVAPGSRIVCAMSGGVDSSVAAALLVERGYEVIGISMRLAGSDDGAHAPARSSGCCSLADFQDAARVADRLEIPHYVFDMREEFSTSVVQPFVNEYLSGRTPSPCILCNREIKFSLLRRKATELGAQHVATGHYARRVREGGQWRLLGGVDRAKDQSYFLFEMGQRELAHTLFPVGGMSKTTVRSEAERLGLVVADKPDSQEICFVPDGRYADVVERLAADRVRPGSIVDEEGRELAGHGGVHRYTVGQRRGLGVAAKEPLYVSALDAQTGRVTVSPRSGLARVGLELTDIVWTSGEAEPDGSAFEVRIRYRHAGVRARLDCPQPPGVSSEAASARIWFDEPQEGVSPGQAAVFYRGDEVIGGGWIRASLTGEPGETNESGRDDRSNRRGEPDGQEPSCG